MKETEKIRDEKENTTDTKEIQIIIKVSFKNLYSVMLEKLNYMDDFFDIMNLLQN